MAFKSWYLKRGRLRLYDGTGTPFFLEVPFRGPVTAPLDRGRPAETLVLDRGRATSDAHYVQGPDDPIYAPLPFRCAFRLANTEPNYSKFLTLLRSPTAGSSTKTVGPNTWTTTKGDTTLDDSDPEGSGTVTTPGFADPQKFCMNVELLYADPDGSSDRGMRWAEVYFPPEQQELAESEDAVMINMVGEIYGRITTVTAFSAGTEG